MANPPLWLILVIGIPCWFIGMLLVGAALDSFNRETCHTEEWKRHRRAESAARPR